MAPSSLGAVVVLLALGAAAAQVPGPAPSSPAAFVDVGAIDSSGKPVLDLTAADLRVSVDGQPRPVRSLRYVFRGEGSPVAARVILPSGPPAAEASRVVVVGVDENTFERGRERAIASGAWRALEGLTSSDHAGVMTLPTPRGRTELSGDREPWRVALGGLTGRAAFAPALARADSAAPLLPPVQVEPGPDSVQREREEAQAERARQGTPGAGGPAGPESGPGEQPSSLRALSRMLDEMRAVPGPKWLIYVAGEAGPEASAELPATGDDDPRLAVEAAALARTSVHLVRVADGSAGRPQRVFDSIAKQTGGTTSTVSGRRADVTRLLAALSGSYLVEIDRLDTDGAQTHALAVTTTRKGVTLTAASRWAARDDPVPAAPAPATSSAPASSTATLVPPPGTAAPAATVTGAGTATPAARGRRGRAAKPDPELDAILARASLYVDGYVNELGSVVAEERYRQTVTRRPAAATSRQTKSDLLLVRTGSGWTPFRDVFELDGKPVRDRQDRLQKLFLEQPDMAMIEGTRISEESARFNIGAVYRTMNTPTIALSFLLPANLGGFRFERHGTDTVEGVDAWRIDFDEIGRPTQIQQATTGKDLPSTGAVWVEPTSGRVVKTMLEVGDQGMVVTVIVVYRPDDLLGLWTPASMRERYNRRDGRETIDCDASYSNFRRFQVNTQEQVGPPKE